MKLFLDKGSKPNPFSCTYHLRCKWENLKRRSLEKIRFSRKFNIFGRRLYVAALLVGPELPEVTHAPLPGQELPPFQEHFMYDVVNAKFVNFSKEIPIGKEEAAQQAPPAPVLSS